MSRQDETLIRCFEAAFPELDADHIRRASVDTVEEWDSLRSITLVAVLEEEFAVEIPLEELPELRSFGAVRDYIHEKLVCKQGS